MKIYNAQSHQKEQFVPITPGEVSLYVCGPTVYNYIHFGNARPLIVFDLLRRYLEYRGYAVRMVSNITDIDDKLINRAREEDTTVEELAKVYTAEFMADAARLEILPFTCQPRATDNIGSIIALIKKLEGKGYAYPTGDGDVYFDTRAYPEYGRLAGHKREDLLSGARVAVDDKKKSPADFALWKAAKPGEPKWPSPWGEGRPGWHIECSAMAMKYLGDTIDIHGGGQDLLFPHHENEKAQSEAATGVPFAHFWVHNAFINMDGEKMSKSLGNVVSLRQVLESYSGEEIRFFFAAAHYRSPLNFSREQMEQARAGLERLYNAKNNLAQMLPGASDAGEDSGDVQSAVDTLKQRFIAAMDDDLNTADAMGALFEYVRWANQYFSDARPRGEVRLALEGLMEVAGVLGILGRDTLTLPAQVAELAARREEARAQKNWAESDRLREVMQSMGYTVEDSKTGQRVSLSL